MKFVSVDDIDQAAAILESGGLVAFPTETVYGLGADAQNPAAVANIYRAKGRPSNHPVIVHLAPGADIADWATDIPKEAQQLIQAFWPGPLTLILKRAAHIPDAVSGGQDTIGLRCPSHPVAQALLRAFKKGQGGVAAPSANQFGRISPTTAQHVWNEFGDHPLVDAVLDGGQSAVGIESTILDLSRLATHGPVLLRPGHISAEQIADVIQIWPDSLHESDHAAPRVSGNLKSHYAPRTPVALVESAQLLTTLQKLSSLGKRVALMYYSNEIVSSANVQLALAIKAVAKAAAYAHDLYAALRAMDSADADIILIETPPQNSTWQGVNDRLARAAYDSLGVLAGLMS